MQGKSVLDDLFSLVRCWRIALVLMTTLPVSYPASVSQQEIRRSMYTYPLVGLVVGLLVWCCAVAATSASLLEAALVLLLWIILTGALHLDGLADCADAWMAGLGDRQKTLDILRDPLCGTIAIVTLFVVLVVKLAAIQQLLVSGNLAVLIVIPVLARVTPIWLFWYLPYVRKDGLGSALQSHASDRHWYAITLIATLVLVPAIAGIAALWLIVITAVVVAGIGYASKQRLGGFTGDVAGATIELIECALCVVAALVV